MTSLHGCVHDVEDLEPYFQGHEDAEVVTFTADLPSDATGKISSPREKDTKRWPTWVNIVSKLKAITQKANKGDLIYIHFSGHGTQKPKEGDMALVLFDRKAGKTRYHYLRGVELARILNCMIEKGLQVTLTLDCCHSGAVMRGDDPNFREVRSVDWDQFIDDDFPLSERDKNNLIKHHASKPRGQHWLYNWLNALDESKYSLISACGPNERAYEYDLKANGEKRGMLSYYFRICLEQLRKGNTHIHSMDSFMGHLHVKFSEHNKQQTPMHRGDGRVSLLMRTSSLSAGYVYVSDIEGGRVSLNVGLVHRVCKGDKYAAYPFEFADHESSNHASAPTQLQVTAVRAFTCDARVIKSPENQPIRKGWKARLLESSAQPIQLIFKKEVRMDELQKTIKNGRYPGLLTASDNDGLPCYYVHKSRDQEYEILDGQENLARNVPKIPCRSSNAIQRVVGIIEHIAQFEHTKSLKNPNATSSFRRIVQLKLEVKHGKRLQEDDQNEIRHNDTLKVTLGNCGDGPLYLWMLGVNDSWEINPSACLVVESKHSGEGRSGKDSREFPQVVPTGETRCDDTIKVLVTTSLISAAALRLPELQKRYPRNGRVSESRDDSDDTLISSEARGQGPHNDFKAFEQPSGSSSIEGDWLVFTFPVRTARSKQMAKRQT